MAVIIPANSSDRSRSHGLVGSCVTTLMTMRIRQVTSCHLVGTLFECTFYHFSGGTSKVFNFSATFSIILSQNAFRLFDHRKSHMIHAPGLRHCTLRACDRGRIHRNPCVKLQGLLRVFTEKLWFWAGYHVGIRCHIAGAWEYQRLKNMSFSHKAEYRLAVVQQGQVKSISH